MTLYEQIRRHRLEATIGSVLSDKQGMTKNKNIAKGRVLGALLASLPDGSTAPGDDTVRAALRGQIERNNLIIEQDETAGNAPGIASLLIANEILEPYLQ